MTVIGKKKNTQTLPFPEQMKGNLDGFAALLKKTQGTRSANLALCSPTRSLRKAVKGQPSLQVNLKILELVPISLISSPLGA